MFTPGVNKITYGHIVRDSSAVRRLFVRLAGAVGRQSALHKENSGFAAPTKVGTFPRFVAIGFYFLSETLIWIASPIIVLFIHNLSTLRKWCYTPLQRDFPLDPMISSFWTLSFWNICHVTSRKLRLPQCIMGDDLHIWSDLVQNRGEHSTCSFRTPWITLPNESFLSNIFCIISFCTYLSCRWNCLSCRIRFLSSCMLLTYANNLARCIK